MIKFSECADDEIIYAITYFTLVPLFLILFPRKKTSYRNAGEINRRKYQGRAETGTINLPTSFPHKVAPFGGGCWKTLTNKAVGFSESTSVKISYHIDVSTRFKFLSIAQTSQFDIPGSEKKLIS